MEGLLHDILALLVHWGPWIVFLVAAAETALFVGLLLPAEATVLLAAFLAGRGYFEVEHVLLATFFGGLTGDQIGYGLGRYGGVRLAARQGLTGRLWVRYERGAVTLFQRRSAIGITLARFISFVRTLMPWFAGMSRVPYRRFLAYDALGVAGWAGGSVALGVLAGGSWEIIVGIFGTLGTVVLLLLLGGLLLAALRQKAEQAAEEGLPPADT
jgi:membrane protein DedA with SNARE-associated domain